MQALKTLRAIPPKSGVCQLLSKQYQQMIGQKKWSIYGSVVSVQSVLARFYICRPTVGMNTQNSTVKVRLIVAVAKCRRGCLIVSSAQRKKDFAVSGYLGGPQNKEEENQEWWRYEASKKSHFSSSNWLKTAPPYHVSCSEWILSSIIICSTALFPGGTAKKNGLADEDTFHHLFLKKFDDFFDCQTILQKCGW